MAKNITYQTVSLVKEKAARIEFGDVTQIKSPRDCYRAIENVFNLENSPQEKFVMLALSTKNEILGAFTVHIGTVNQSFACTKDILQRAILSNASCIIVAHNHPSGNSEPSKEDKAVTERIKQACEILDIQLLDHVIIGDGNRFSFAEKGLI